MSRAAVHQARQRYHRLASSAHDGQSATEWVLINVALCCVFMSTRDLGVCLRCVCVRVRVCVWHLRTDGGLIISAASLWLQHAISDARGNGDHAAVCIEVIDDGTNPQAVISATLPRYVSEPVSAATRCALLVLGSCCRCRAAVWCCCGC